MFWIEKTDIKELGVTKLNTISVGALHGEGQLTVGLWLVPSLYSVELAPVFPFCVSSEGWAQLAKVILQPPLPEPSPQPYSILVKKTSPMKARIHEDFKGKWLLVVRNCCMCLICTTSLVPQSRKAAAGFVYRLGNKGLERQRKSSKIT